VLYFCCLLFGFRPSTYSSIVDQLYHDELSLIQNFVPDVHIKYFSLSYSVVYCLLLCYTFHVIVCAYYSVKQKKMSFFPVRSTSYTAVL